MFCPEAVWMKMGLLWKVIDSTIGYSCSMNAPVMVNLEGETDPLEVCVLLTV